MNDPEVIRWLESPQGEMWSREQHRPNGNMHCLFKVKSDELGDDDSMHYVYWGYYDNYRKSWEVPQERHRVFDLTTMQVVKSW